MTNVYLLKEYIPYEGKDILGVFSTKELAEEGLDKIKNNLLKEITKNYSEYYSGEKLQNKLKEKLKEIYTGFVMETVILDELKSI